MKILIAPDNFKGALNAREAAENIAKGLRDALPDAKIEIVSMADGGEGTAEVICNARGGCWVNCKARDRLDKLTWIATPVAADVSPANARMHPTRLPPQLKIIAAVDVKNPLLGTNGATRVFGPQKGATKDDIDILERALTTLADVVAQKFGFDYRNEPGAGAAGGLGFGMMSFCGAKIRPGFDVVAEAVGLEAKIEDADIVVTGEGSLDRQTLEGKTPGGVARLARKLGKRVFAMVGRATNDTEVRKVFDGVSENTRPGMSREENMKRAAELLRENARELAKSL